MTKGFNRTFMELKQDCCISNIVCYDRFNRTFMELKQNPNDIAAIVKEF